MDLVKLYGKQISFTEWFEDIKHVKTKEIREEDNDKRERLAEMSKIIGIGFDKPDEFPATELAEYSDNLKRYLEVHGNELCALRLIPIDPSLPKLRMRGHTKKDAMNWFKEQKIDPKNYRAQFMPHADNYDWSTIFVVNTKGIFGVIQNGTHAQVTQGFYDDSNPITFSYDFKSWNLSEENESALNHLKEITNAIKVNDLEKRKQLETILKSTFVNNYIKGYFETTSTKEYGVWFIDYSRALESLFENYLVNVHKKENNKISGQTGCMGKANGKVVIVNVDDINTVEFNNGDILVCPMTSPDYVPLMQKAAAIVTDMGGILTHAAIIARELNKPCVVGTLDATKKLQTGNMVEVDATNGVVNILK
jgi:phosphoenolpyruvate synthase/pyruvate phosphate dikinase